jgi:hypothetical protein
MRHERRSLPADDSARCVVRGSVASDLRLVRRNCANSPVRATPPSASRNSANSVRTRARAGILRHQRSRPRVDGLLDSHRGPLPAKVEQSPSQRHDLSPRQPTHRAHIRSSKLHLNQRRALTASHQKQGTRPLTARALLPDQSPDRLKLLVAGFLHFERS